MDLRNQQRRIGDRWIAGAIAYWLESPPDSTQEQIRQGMKEISEFVKYTYMLTTGTGLVLMAWEKEWPTYEKMCREGIKNNPEAGIYMGKQFPDQDQEIGKSTIVYVKMSELLKAGKPNGVFHRNIWGSHIVNLYQRWEDHSRGRIARIFGVKKNSVECTVMGEMRELRNIIVHCNGKIEKEKFLPTIGWGLVGEELRIGAEGMNSIAEQIHNMTVRVERETMHK